MTTQHQTISADERLRRQELDLDDRDDGDDRDTGIHDAADVRTVRDEDIVDAKGETIAEKPLITPPMPTPTRSEPSERVDADTSVVKAQTAPAGQAVPNPGFGTPDLPGHDDAQASERWQHIQAEFVDDPRKAVGDAHQLVGDLVQRIVDAFAKERNDLEQQWSKGDSVSTEDLRVCLQHYRAFFSRLLPSANGAQHS